VIQQQKRMHPVRAAVHVSPGVLALWAAARIIQRPGPTAQQARTPRPSGASAAKRDALDSATLNFGTDSAGNSGRIVVE